MTEKAAKPRIVILGGGIAGIRAARKLANEAVDVLIIDHNNYQVFQPLLYQVATSMLSADEVIYPIRGFFRSASNVNFLLAEIEGIDAAAQTVRTDQGEIGYDHLIIALGSTPNFFGSKSIEENSLPLKTLVDSIEIRSHVLKVFEEASREKDAAKRKALLTFVFVGGGFAGVEAIAELEDMVRADVAKIPSIDQEDVHFVLVEGSRRILPELTEELSGYGLEQLRERGIDVRLSTFLNSCVDGHVVLSDGTEFDADTIVWTAGVKASPVLAESDLPIEGRGRVTTLPTLQVARDGVVVDGAWAAGDCAAVPDLTSEDPEATCAPTAQHAVRQAGVLADNLVAVLAAGPQGRAELTPYAHESLGTVATLGIGKGVARIMGHNLRGFAAWTAHRSYHVYAMPTINRKVRIMMDWFAAVVFRRDLASFGSAARPGAAFAEAARHDALLAERRRSDRQQA